MAATNEDFLFAQESLSLGFVTEAQVEEGFALQARMADDLQLDERLSVILVKRGYLAEEQARRVYAKIQPQQGEPGEIQGYRLLEVIGRGAMGTVYRALHLGLHREVALKILRQDLAGDRTQIERLRAEAAMLASLDHPNIVRALDAGESNGFPFFVMEYVEGETLRDRLRREGPLAEAEALRIARCVADALERARRMGVVHRDVKPGNVLISKAGVPKLMDLGLAKGPIDLGLTQHGATVGTPQYIAPEQALDPRKADTRSDIYGLGATLYAMLTGHPPFDGQTLAEILTKVLYQTPTPVRVLRPDASPEAGYLVERMMLRDPALRHRTPAQVVLDIDRLLQGTSILPPGFQGNWEAYLVRRQSRRLVVVAGATMAAAVAVAFGVRTFVERGRAEDARRSTEARIADWLTVPLAPRDDAPGLRRRAREGRELAREAGGAAPRNQGELRSRLSRIEEELGWLDVVAQAEAQSAQLEERNDFAAAERLWRTTIARIPAYGPAKALAEVRLGAVRFLSDQALEEGLASAFTRRPGRIEDVSDALDRWRQTVGRLAPTARQTQEATEAAAAADAVRQVAAAVGEGKNALLRGRIAERLAALELAGLRADVSARRAAAERELDLRLPAVTRHGFYNEGLLHRLVAEPFEDLEKMVAGRVDQHYRLSVAPEADRLAAEGRTVEALDGLLAFARAAAEEGAYPEVARAAAAQHAELEARHRAETERARAAFETLTVALVDRLRADDLPGARALFEEAARDPALYRPLSGPLARLAKVPDLYEAFWSRALDGLEARRGPDRALWLDPVALADGTTERNWEVRSVDRATRTFVVVSHRGGFPQKPATRSLAQLSPATRVALARLREGVPEDEALRAVHALAALPREVADFHARLDGLRRVREAFHRAGDDDGPLAAWLDAQIARLAAEVAAFEEAAGKHLENGRRRMSEGNYVQANYHFRLLQEPPLSYSAVARANEGEIAREVNRIRVELKMSDVQLALVTSKVTPRTQTPDALDVDILFELNTVEQVASVGSIFTAGLARLVSSGPGRVVTPESDPNDMALLLLPDQEGEVVTDRPLALEAFLDPSRPRSIAFDYWPRSHPLLLVIDLDGVHVAVLSADPRRTPFPPDVPRLDGERNPPKFDFHGRGRGVTFHVGPEIGDPAAWDWDDAHQGRHFVPPEVDREKVRDKLGTRFFAFEPNRQKPYRVKFEVEPDLDHDRGGVRLEIDGQTVLSDSGAAYKGLKRSKTPRYQILTYTTAMIDNLAFTGRVDPAWLDRTTRKEGTR
jgi:serine/threonine-protein kinase